MTIALPFYSLSPIYCFRNADPLAGFSMFNLPDVANHIDHKNKKVGERLIYFKQFPSKTKKMKTVNFSQTLLFLLLLVTATSCDVVLDIFEAGLWVGIILVILVIALAVWLLKKFF